MNIVFFGSDDFAVSSLKLLISKGRKIDYLVTQPDKKMGRGMHVGPTPVKLAAIDLNFKIFQPEDVNSPEALKFLHELSPDLFIVIAYGQILSSQLLEIPKVFSINIHASLLPKYRGAAPINRVLINGEKETGVTAIKMNEEMDAGDIIIQNKITIDEEDCAITLRNKLSELGASTLIEAIEKIENNNYKITPQDAREITLAPKMSKADGLINWKKSAKEINNLIRGCYDWPGAFTYFSGKLLKIYKAQVFLQVEGNGKANPGEIVKVIKDDIVVCTGGGDLMIEELQIEGKRRMLTKEFITGHKIKAGDVFSENK